MVKSVDLNNISSASSTNSLNRKSQINFIERNKANVSNSRKPQSEEPNSVLIKCLNDLDQVNLSSNKSNQNEEIDISIISVQSSILSDKQEKEVCQIEELEEKEVKIENCLVQGEQCEEKPEENLIIESNVNLDEDVNISKYDSDKSKVRSQFMQRFGSVQAKRREIIPTMIENLTENTLKQTLGSTSCESMARTLNLDTENIQAASIAASIAAINAVTQPFVKMQTDLDNKISSVIKQLEILRQSEENLVPKLIEKRSKQSIEYLDQNLNENSEFARIKYLEQVQQSQFQLMSQLICMLGQNKETSNKEEILNQTTEPRIINTNLGETKILKSKRSKSQTKAKNKSQSADKFRKERKFSGYSSCSSCDRSKSRNRSKSKSPGRKKNPEFLEKLLDTAPKSPSPPSVHFELKNEQMSKKQKSDFLNESQPSLFDKYLHEVKQISKEFDESCGSQQTLVKNISNISEILKTSNQLLDELERQEAQETGSVKLPALTSTVKTEKQQIISDQSMFSDIKQVLKACEKSKSQIETSLGELSRERNKNMFYLLNSNQDNERNRIKKLVDGCISAISNDVQKVVSQKLIDEAKHVKLEAERDVPSKRQNQRNSRIARSTSATELAKPNAKQISDVHKYLGKIYGKSLLDQIKSEQQEEKNRILKEEMQRKKQIELEKNQKRAQAKLVKNVQNKNNQKQKPKPTEPVPGIVKPVPKIALDLQRPAFISTPFQSYPENRLKSFGHMSQSCSSVGTSRQIAGGENVAIITIVPREVSPKPKNIIKQNLPSLSINPSEQTNNQPKQEAPKEVLKSDQTIQTPSPRPSKDNSDLEINQTGSGIHIPGYKQPDTNQLPSLRLFDPNPPGDLSNETSEFLKARNIYENRVFDYIEQEILAKFLNKLVLELPEQEEDKEDKVNHLELENFQLFVDPGQEFDPNLIECLIQEVLEEKIISMLNLEEESKHNAPLPSPRKSLDFLEQQKEKPNGLEVTTPNITPSPSPVNIPPSPPKLEEKPEPIQRPQLNISQPSQEIIQLIQLSDETESILDVTLEEIDQEPKSIRQDSIKSIILPPTPVETPVPSISPPETPSVSIHERSKTPPPEIPQQPKQVTITKNLVTTSVQCDPEPRIEIKQTKQEIAKKLSSSTNETELTESTQYESGSLSTTLTTETQEEEEEEEEETDSYFSDGAWLISKSEGEIVRKNHNSYINLDLVSAAKGLMLNPRKKSLTEENSEGEIRIDKISPENIGMYGGKPNPGVNKITRALEQGEIDKSEGEIENPAIRKQKEMFEFSSKMKHKYSIKKSEKKVVSLSVSPEKTKKNNIKIKPIKPNEVLVRDSNDFERKMFSSTPDTSMYAGANQLSNSNQILNDVFEDEGPEVSIQIDNSPDRKPKRRPKISSEIIEMFTEDNDEQDTLSNVSDLEN